MGELVAVPDAILACALAPKSLKIEDGFCSPVCGRERCEAILKSLDSGVQKFEGEQSVLVAGGGKVDVTVWDNVAVGVWGTFENAEYLRGKVEAEGEAKEAELVARLFRKFGEAASLTKIWGQFSFIACDLKNDRVFAARSTLSPVELIEGHLDDDVLVVVSSTARHLLEGAVDITTIPVGHFVSGHRRATVPVQFKHTDEQLEQTAQASRDAVSRALANMPALLTAGPKSRPETPEIAPASGGAWSSRARASRNAAATSSATSTSGPAYAPESKGGGTDSAATWRRSSFDGPRNTSNDGPRRGSLDMKRRGSLDLPSSTTVWVPATKGFSEELPAGRAAAAAANGAPAASGRHGHDSAAAAHVRRTTTVDEGNEGEAIRSAAAEADTAAADAAAAVTAPSSSRSLVGSAVDAVGSAVGAVGSVKNWMFGAFGAKKSSESNLEAKAADSSTSRDSTSQEAPSA